MNIFTKNTGGHLCWYQNSPSLTSFLYVSTQVDGSITGKKFNFFATTWYTNEPENLPKFFEKSTTITHSDIYSFTLQLDFWSAEGRPQVRK